MDWKGLIGLPLFGALFGYLGGILSEPIKAHINEWRRRRPLRKNLYAEIANTYSGLVVFLAPEKLDILQPRFAENIKDYARTQIYDYAQTQPELFYGLREWAVITQVNESLKRIQQSDDVSDIAAGEPFAAQKGKNLISLIEEAALSGALSIRRFSKVKPDISGRLLEIQAGKRRKSSEIYMEMDKRLLEEAFRLLAPNPPPAPPS